MITIIKNDNTKIESYNIESRGYDIICMDVDGIITVKLSDIKSILFTTSCTTKLLISI